MSPGVDNVMVVPTCRRKRPTIDDDRFVPTMGSTVYINGSIMMRRGLTCVLGSQALMCPHAVVKGSVIGGTAHRRSVGNSMGMTQTAMFVDNRPMACNCRGSLTDGGVPTGRDMERQVGMLRGSVPRFSEYCRGDHTSMRVVNVDIASTVH